jgi:A/G-specific adenine glycosylase
MLQQTRTEAVKPYFNSWMEKFPNAESLAKADEAEVLHAWQGLGYYSRARHLHEAAQKIVSDFGGKIPSDKKDLLSLPGIGAYTAGAILSIAFGQKEPAVDGNVLRVYARLYDVEDDILSGKGKKEIERLVEETIPDKAGDFNEALMDLGSLVCISKAPRCKSCPLREYCRAYALGKAETLPVRTKKKPQKVRYIACAVYEKNGKALLHVRPSTGMLASMWEFPMAEDDSEEQAKQKLEEVFQGTVKDMVWSHTHVFTHRIWHMKAYWFEKGQFPKGPAWQYFSPEEYREIPLAGPHSLLAAAMEHRLDSYRKKR